MPATTRENAERIERSIERSVFGFDASVTELRKKFDFSPNGGNVKVAVLISTYLVYDHGASAKLYPDRLQALLKIVGQTKGFMLSDDRAHADLWRR